jgi:hypothetical protein
VSFPGGAARRLDAGSQRRLLSLTDAGPSSPFEAGSTSSQRKLMQGGSVRWSISDCSIVSGNSVRCSRGFAVACCNTQVCSSNPDGRGGSCPSNTILGCCGKK